MINPDDYGPYWWSNPYYWDDYYKEELAGDWPESSQVRRSQYFEKYTRRYGLKPPLEVLYAGVGISLFGDLMAHMGYHVTAIDISRFALDFRRNAKDVEELLWKCADWRNIHPYFRNICEKLLMKIWISMLNRSSIPCIRPEVRSITSQKTGMIQQISHMAMI